MFFKKIWLLSLALSLCCSLTVYGSESERYLTKKKAFSLGVGNQYFPSSDFTDAWNMDTDDFKGDVLEFSYEFKLNKNLGFDFCLGYSQDKIKSDMSSIADAATSELDLNIICLSPSAKLYLPLGKTFLLYAGIGPDLAFSYGTYDFIEPGVIAWELEYDEVAYGAHGIAGIEWYIYKNPADSTGGGSFYYDWPVSIQLQYRYSWMEVEEFDKEMVGALNINYTLSLSENDIDIGGQTITLGLRWHF